MPDRTTLPIMGEPRANDVRERVVNSHHISANVVRTPASANPVRDLANAVRRHRDTDGAEPVQPHHEDAVLSLPPVGVAAAAHLLLARDRAECDPAHADRLVLGVIDAAAANDPDIGEIRGFYAD